MSGDIPSFIKPFDDYNDLFLINDLVMLSKSLVAVPTQVKKKATLTEKMRYSLASGSLAGTP